MSRFVRSLSKAIQVTDTFPLTVITPAPQNMAREPTSGKSVGQKQQLPCHPQPLSVSLV